LLFEPCEEPVECIFIGLLFYANFQAGADVALYSSMCSLAKIVSDAYKNGCDHNSHIKSNENSEAN
jgi:hypothetical protein